MQRFARSRGGKEEYRDLESLLRQEHPKDSLLGSPYGAEVSTSTVLRDVLDGRATGFVAVKGGQETSNDKLKHLFAYVPQRAKIKQEELGAVVEEQLKGLYNKPKEAAAKKKALLGRHYTLCKRYADLESAGVLVMSTTLFAWLYKQRRFRDFELVHFLHYEFRSWPSDFLSPMLASRQKLKEEIVDIRAGRSVGDASSKGLRTEILKLIINSW